MFFSFSSRFFLFSILTISLPANLVFAGTVVKEATFYSDAFEGGSTANGDIFHQADYSAAVCDIPLGRFLYVSKGGTGVVVKANDRPNCARDLNIIDFSRDVFSLFAPTSLGRLADLQVTDIGNAPIGQSKGFLPKNNFSHLGITLISSIPNILFVNQGIEIRGKVTSPSDYVIVYISHTEDPDTKESSLVKVGKDGIFSARILLPKKIGNYTFVIARGKSFNTDSYATLTLIDPESLTYPPLPTQKYTFVPRISTVGNTSTISLPENIFGELTLNSKNKRYKTNGTTLILRNTGFKPGEAQVHIGGYALSTTSPLDRKSQITTLFSGSVILDRTHEVTGADKVLIRIKNNNAKIRFVSPYDKVIRGDYYLTLPNGDVQKLLFNFSNIDIDGNLIPGKVIEESLLLPSKGVYLLEVLEGRGIAYINTPIIQGKIWPILKQVSEKEATTIRNNKKLVQEYALKRINTMRVKLGELPLILDDNISKLAQMKVDDMIARKYQEHRDPDGNYIDGFAQKRGFSFDGNIAENIGYGSVSDISLQDGLEESGGHRHNMILPEMRKLGIGYGVNNNMVYVVQVFEE